MSYTACYYIDSLVQDCSNSSALAMELLQSCTKPSIYRTPMTVEYTPKFEPIKDTPMSCCNTNTMGYLLWEFGENWQQYKGTLLYSNFISNSDQKREKYDYRTMWPYNESVGALL